MMKEEVNKTCNTSLKYVLKTLVKILFLSQLQKIRDLASEEIASHYNWIDEMTEVIKEF